MWMERKILQDDSLNFAPLEFANETKIVSKPSISLHSAQTARSSNLQSMNKLGRGQNLGPRNPNRNLWPRKTKGGGPRKSAEGGKERPCMGRRQRSNHHGCVSPHVTTMGNRSKQTQTNSSHTTGPLPMTRVAVFRRCHQTVPTIPA